MNKLEKLKAFVAEELEIEDGDGYDVYWPKEDCADTLFVYTTASYNNGLQSVDFYAKFHGEGQHIKHDISESFAHVVRFENGEWAEKNYKIVTKCEIED
jgi:hypothetical protein